MLGAWKALVPARHTAITHRFFPMTSDSSKSSFAKRFVSCPDDVSKRDYLMRVVAEMSDVLEYIAYIQTFATLNPLCIVDEDNDDDDLVDLADKIQDRLEAACGCFGSLADGRLFSDREEEE